MQLFCQSVNRNHTEPHHISHNLAQTASQQTDPSTSQALRHHANQQLQQLIRLQGSYLDEHSARKLAGLSKATKLTWQSLNQACLQSQSASLPARADCLGPTVGRKQAVCNLYTINTMWHLAPRWARFITHILGSSINILLWPNFHFWLAGSDSVTPPAPYN